MKIKILLLTALLATFLFANNQKKIIYLTPDISIPFWQIIAKGVKESSTNLTYDLEVFSSDNSSKKELQNTIKAIKAKPVGIVISPTNSSNCVTVLKLIKKANIPVVIADIGTDGGEYLSYISSDNFEGAYKLGKYLTNFMKQKNITDSSVGIIAIPQKRENGKLRTAGFMKALKEDSIKSADMRQQVDFSSKETYFHTKDLLSSYPNMKVIWLQGSDKYKSALKAIKESKRKVHLLTFDAEPEFLELIPNGTIILAGMQQPFLIGERAVKTLDSHLNKQYVQKNIQLSVLAISSENIDIKLEEIKRNVLGISNEAK